MKALIDFSVTYRPAASTSALEVPIPDLARRVMSLYWDQSQPFDGVKLRQSFAPRALILNSVESLRSAVGYPGTQMTFDAAARLEPEEFGRHLEAVVVCLAQQPLHRLQRVPGPLGAGFFLYDGSFLHDKVTKTELSQHDNAIRLHPGVAHGLATYEGRLSHELQTLWVDEVLRMNQISSGARLGLEEHLFARARGEAPHGKELSRSEVAHLLQDSQEPPQLPPAPTGSAGDSGPRQGRIVLHASITSIKDYCSMDQTGCWMAPSAGPVACRADGDDRAEADLPMLAPHRWAWMVIHGRSDNPLPENIFHVRRQCGKAECCKPEHLYLTTVQGEEITVAQAAALLHSGLGRHRRDDSQRNAYSAVGSATFTPDSLKFNSPKTSAGLALFANRLNQLFETSPGPEGTPYTSGEVAAALQEDGLNVSHSLITRLREGLGDYPSKQTIEALAYFFNVDLDYLSAAARPEEAEWSIPITVKSGPSAIPPSGMSPTRRGQVIRISVDDIGLIITGLSETIAECLARREMHPVSGLLSLLADLGEVLSMANDKNRIGRPLLRRIVDEWRSVARDLLHLQLLARLSALVADD